MTLSTQVAAAVIVLDECGVFVKKKRKSRELWSKLWLLNRKRYSHMNLLDFIRSDNPQDFQNYIRMTEENYNILLQKVKPFITKKDTMMRNAITPEERLTATLQFLATGRSFEDLKFSAVISPQALGRIIPETCKAIYKSSKEEYFKFPKTSVEWERIAREYDALWNFPNCGEAIDGKHVKIFKPANEGSYYFNYKGYHSIVLLAIVDANLSFIMADVGCNGRVSDGGVIEETVFYRKLKSGELNLLNKENTVCNMNYVFVADEAHALRHNLLKPFPRKDLIHERRIFNYRLSRARRCVENALIGLLASRFRIFHTTINPHPSKVDDIVMVCVVLHNFLRNNNRAQYSPTSMLEREDLESERLIKGDWRNDQPQDSFHGLGQSRKLGSAKEAFDCRDVYVKYFNGPGRVSFQERMVKK